GSSTQRRHRGSDLKICSIFEVAAHVEIRVGQRSEHQRQPALPMAISRRAQRQYPTPLDITQKRRLVEAGVAGDENAVADSGQIRKSLQIAMRGIAIAITRPKIGARPLVGNRRQGVPTELLESVGRIEESGLFEARGERNDLAELPLQVCFASGRVAGERVNLRDKSTPQFRAVGVEKRADRLSGECADRLKTIVG